MVRFYEVNFVFKYFDISLYLLETNSYDLEYPIIKILRMLIEKPE